MNWIIIFLVWLIAPFAELGIIIALSISNNKYKQQIAQQSRTDNGRPMYQRAVGCISGNDTETIQENPVPQPQNISAGPEKGDIQSFSDSNPWPEKKKSNSAMKYGSNLGSKLLTQAQNNLGTIALVLGVIFIVLAGLIFATTTWHSLSDLTKTFLVFICACVFFGASFLAEKTFQIHKTGNAFYILGSVFLSLTLLAAAYFKLLGPRFILEGQHRWMVLWVGSMILELSFLTGITRFDDSVFTQATLWGMSVSMFFLAKACLMGWSVFLSVMMIYSCILILAGEYFGRFQSDKGERSFRCLMAAGFPAFAPVHFLVFGILVSVRGLLAIGGMLLEGIMGIGDSWLGRFSLFTFTGHGTAALVFLTLGILILRKKKNQEVYGSLLQLALMELIFYGGGRISINFVWRLLAVNFLFFLRKGVSLYRNSENPDELIWEIGGLGALACTVIHLYSSQNVSMGSLIFCLAAFIGYYAWFYCGRWQWLHLLAAVLILPLPFTLLSRNFVTFDEMGSAVFGALFLSGLLTRKFYPIIVQEKRVQGGWRIDWFQILSILTVFLIAQTGDARWRFAAAVYAAVYALQYQTVRPFRKWAFFTSAGFLAIAFWQQPFFTWPGLICLELNLLPAAILIWVTGILWKDLKWIKPLQTAGYVACLTMLCMDAVVFGKVGDALILEGICLTIFVWAQIKNRTLWVRISGALSLFVVLFMTRAFWLSLSWWVYLLGAGVGLILFAGVLERRRK